MTNEGSAPSNNVLPKEKFYYQIEGPSVIATFQEEAGLHVGPENTNYRSENHRVLTVFKMPGIAKLGSITLKKVVFKSDNKSKDWLNEFKMNKSNRETVTITLMEESGVPSMIWTIFNACPIKIADYDLNNSDEIHIESIEFVHEGITISNS
jgi:phage tail-like protein